MTTTERVNAVILESRRLKRSRVVTRDGNWSINMLSPTGVPRYYGYRLATLPREPVNYVRYAPDVPIRQMFANSFGFCGHEYAERDFARIFGRQRQRGRFFQPKWFPKFLYTKANSLDIKIDRLIYT